IKVNPFTFEPQEAGLPLTPLRAYAHAVPHYYLQNFGQAASNPNSNDYAAFAQDTIRVTDHLAVNLGVRCDLQTFTNAGLQSNPLFPPAGKVPYNPRNFGPRAGLAYSIGKNHPLVIRAGYGIFYVRIPQIYNSAIVTENGINDAQVFLNNNIYADRQVFPTYPNPLVTCSLTSANCNLPQGFTEGVTNDVSAFAPNFVTPRVQQASLTLEPEVADHTTVAVSYLYVHGEHLIPALDVNLPQPVALTYPIFDSTGSIFQNGYYTVDSFATWQYTQSATCTFPRALILSDVPSPNWARSTNSRAPPPASTTAQRFPSTAAWLAGLIFASPIPTPMPSTTVRTPWLRANLRPCRIPINPMPSVAPASPTSATDSLPPSPPSRASSIAATNFSAMFSTTGKFPASSPPAAGVP
ncbi:MAG: TonB-dependent receptor, partial [Candidatus Sulfotelmatobacter sp.]